MTDRGLFDEEGEVRGAAGCEIEWANQEGVQIAWTQFTGLCFSFPRPVTYFWVEKTNLRKNSGIVVLWRFTNA